MYNEHVSLTSKHEITLDVLTYNQNESIVIFGMATCLSGKTGPVGWGGAVEYTDCIFAEG